MSDLKFYAKYPFTSFSKQYIRELKLDFENLPDDSIDFAYEILVSTLKGSAPKYSEIENSKESFLKKYLISYPLSNIIINLSKKHLLKKQYALAKAKQVMNYLFFDTEKNLVKVSEDLFQVEDGRIKLSDYLNNLPNGEEWKLIYQDVKDGWVTTDKNMLAHLVAEKVFSTIMDTKIGTENFPKLMKFYANELRSKQVKAEFSDDLGAVNMSAFPPCMKKIITMLQTDPKVGHMSRFVVATFLVNIGMKDDEIVRLFSKQENFKESLVRYHINNIKGKTGNMIKYSVPGCAKMETYGTCYKDSTCKWKHPLSYYKYTKKRIEKNKKRNKRGQH